VVLIFLLFIAKAYLEIIKTAYFDEKTKIFDRENRFVLFYALLNTIVVIVMVFNPFEMMEKLKDMFYVIFL